MGKGNSDKPVAKKASKETKPNRPIPAAKKAKEAKEAKKVAEAASKKNKVVPQAKGKAKEAAAKKAKEVTAPAKKDSSREGRAASREAEAEKAAEAPEHDPTAVPVSAKKVKKDAPKKAAKAAKPAKVPREPKPPKAPKEPKPPKPPKAPKEPKPPKAPKEPKAPKAPKVPKEKKPPKEKKEKKVKAPKVLAPGINPATGRATPKKVTPSDVLVVYDAVQNRKATSERTKARVASAPPVYNPQYSEYSNVSRKKINYFENMKTTIEACMVRDNQSYLIFEPYPNHHLVGPTLAPFLEYCKTRDFVAGRKKASETQLRALGYKTRTMPAGPRFFTVVARDRDTLAFGLSRCSATDDLAGVPEAEATRGTNKPPRKWAAKYWSKEDAEVLVVAYERLGSWAKIKAHPDYAERFECRTEVNLKDKYRNLFRAAQRMGSAGQTDNESYAV
jgi:hypothetical protein